MAKPLPLPMEKLFSLPRSHLRVLFELGLLTKRSFARFANTRLTPPSWTTPAQWAEFCRYVRRLK